MPSLETKSILMKIDYQNKKMNFIITALYMTTIWAQQESKSKQLTIPNQPMAYENRIWVFVLF